MNGGGSGGTIESGMVMFKELKSDPAVGPIMAHPYSLTSHFRDEAALKELPDKGSPGRPQWSKAAQSWCGPFIMASHNEKIVRMSNALLGWKLGALVLSLNVPLQRAAGRFDACRLISVLSQRFVCRQADDIRGARREGLLQGRDGVREIGASRGGVLLCVEVPVAPQEAAHAWRGPQRG